VFVPGTVPGDVAQTFFVEKKKTFARAQVKRILEQGEGRVGEACPVASKCGGCSWQHMDYGVQLEWKTKIVEEAFHRIARVFDCEISPCVPSPKILGYRNKVEVPVAYENGQVVAGFYEPYTHNVVPAQDCLVEHPAVRNVIKHLLDQVRKRRYKVYNEKTGRGAVRHLVARVAPGTDEAVAVLVSTGHRLSGLNDMASELMESIPNLRSVVLNVNDEATNMIFGDRDYLIAGRPYIQDVFGSETKGSGSLGRLRFRISPRSFYQVNSYQAVNLYTTALSWAELKPNDVVYDVYSGIGTISLFAALRASFVVGVEEVEPAVKDAFRNARDNGIENVTFKAGKAARAIPGLLAEYPRPDVVIMDPPRGGAEKETLAAIADIKPRSIVYVSCNPSTFARDMLFLKERGWKAVKCQPFDMFPMTSHVEMVVSLSHKKADTHINIDVEFGDGKGQIPIGTIARKAEEYSHRIQI
ncbi:MAG: 23S rRNA (uracil(1939)-C(5))-methyltransferase RlmD, partial [Nitrospira sp.]|nr:23S rRNA (uracil(1939)-C(5))-methyltransferase RlmD [Nitrospira sp.]